MEKRTDIDLNEYLKNQKKATKIYGICISST